MLINITRTGISATRSARGAVVAFPMVAVSLGAFSGHCAPTGS